jgi:hypothetical protein
VGQTSYTSDGFALVNGDRILFMNASSGTYLNKVYTVAGVGTSITLTLATDGQSGTGAPTNGDALYATQGTVNGGKIFVYSSTSATWVQASSPAGTLLAANNLSDVSNAATTRANISAAKSGANSDITSLTGLTTPLSTAQGGTGAGVLTGYRYANGSGADTASTTIPYSALIGVASSGANSNITSLTGLTTALPVNEGGTGAATAAANSVFGNATGSTAAPGFTQNPSVVTLQASSAITTPLFNASTCTGTAQAEVLTLSPALLSQAVNTAVQCTPVAANTGAGATLNVNGLGARTITKCGGQSIAANDLITGTAAYFTSTGTTWELLNPIAGGCGTSTSGVTSQYALSQMTATQSVSTGTIIRFPAPTVSSGTDISYSSYTFTLAGGKTYRIVSSIGYSTASSSTGGGTVYIRTGSTGGSGTIISQFAADPNSSTTQYISSPNLGYFLYAPSVSTTIHLESGGGIGSVGAYSEYPWISIEEIPATTSLPAGSATGNTLAGLKLGTDTGTAQAHVVALSPAITSNQAGTEVYFIPAAANTATAPTLAVNGLTAMTITVCGTSAAAVGDLATSTIADVVSDGTYWQLQNSKVTICGSTATTLTANGGANTAISGISTSGVGVSGNSTGNYGGIFSGSYGVEGISANGSGYGVYGTSTSNYGVFGLSVSGVGVIGQQNGALTANTTQPVLYGVRSSTLGSYTSTGAIIRGEDLSASTGNLLELVKQGTTDLSVDNAGALHVGPTVSPTWGSAYKVLDLNSYGVLVGSYNGAGWTGTSYGQSEWGQNTYFTGASYAVGTGNASTILQSAGQLEFANAPSVSAGAVQTFTPRFDIFSSGNVAIGTTTDAGYKLQVAGTISVNSGTSQVYRCASDGNLKAGQLTTNSSDCGTSVALGLYVR